MRTIYSHSKHLFLFILIAVACAGCSRKKSGFTNKLYHGTTSHYNWYFNANELMKQTEAQLWLNKEDDYLSMLPVYVLPSEEEQKNLYPVMDQIIEKCSTVIDRHSMEIKRKEYNKWIDDNFLLIGIANYYKGKYSTAEEMFTYTAKKYKGQESRFDAALWLARTYSETERYNKALTVLSVIEKDNGKDKPKDFQARSETVLADLYLRQDRFRDALPHLEDAARLTEDKPMKARLTFILAQCYKELSKSSDAIESYQDVVKLRPDYEMEFYAKISQALAFDRRLDSKKIKEMLREMARDEKNEEYYDQIYFALAEIEYEEQNVDKAIELFKLSANKSLSNARQKGKSFLRLAEIYFTDREYVMAKNYYDSTATFLPEDYPDYDIIIRTGRSLEGLVTNLQIIEYNDSTIALASLDEKEREKKILKLIAKLEAEEEAKRQEELAALERIQNQGTFSTDKGRSGNSKTWYFYNSGALSSGYQSFKQQWGDRKLEDNWRRNSKTDFKISDAADGTITDTLLANLGQQTSNVRTLDEYLSDLPLSDSAFTASHWAIIQALYQVGTIYKEGLRDNDNAIESFLRITNDYDTSGYALQANYQLYLVYLGKEQAGGFVGTGFKDNSEYYKNVILADFPDSEFAKLILNPEYVTSKNQRYEAEKVLYEETYKQFNRRQYTDVLITCNTVIQDEPNNNFLPKYYLMKALTVGARKDADNYEALLREIITKFTGTSEAAKASELLGNLNDVKAQLAREQAQRDKASGSDTLATTSNNTANNNSPAVSDVNTSMFASDESAEHFFALVFPKTEGNSTTIKETIAQFHDVFFKNSGLRITNSFIDKDNQIIIIRSFDNQSLAMDYYDAFVQNADKLKDINEKDYQKFVISTKNFTVLFRNKNADVYQTFFQSTYL